MGFEKRHQSGVLSGPLSLLSVTAPYGCVSVDPQLKRGTQVYRSTKFSRAPPNRMG